MMCGMLLAEALAARKDTIKEITDLTDRLKGAVVRYEDQEGDDAAEVMGALSSALDRLERLTINIHRANNDARLVFDGRDLSVMEAIALRERMSLEAKARHASVEAIERAVGVGHSGRGWLAGRRAKDDLRELPTVDLRAERRMADGLSASIRRLDLTIQQKNWTTGLAD